MFPTRAEGTAPFRGKAPHPPLSTTRSGPPRGSPEPAPRVNCHLGHGARPVFSRLEGSGQAGGVGHGGPRARALRAALPWGQRPGWALSLQKSSPTCPARDTAGPSPHRCAGLSHASRLPHLCSLIHQPNTC